MANSTFNNYTLSKYGLIQNLNNQIVDLTAQQTMAQASFTSATNAQQAAAAYNTAVQAAAATALANLTNATVAIQYLGAAVAGTNTTLGNFTGLSSPPQGLESPPTFLTSPPSLQSSPPWTSSPPWSSDFLTAFNGVPGAPSIALPSPPSSPPTTWPAGDDFLGLSTTLLNDVNTMVIYTLRAAENALWLASTISNESVNGPFQSMVGYQVSSLINADATMITTDASNAVNNAITAFNATLAVVNAAFMASEPLADAAAQLQQANTQFLQVQAALTSQYNYYYVGSTAANPGELTNAQNALTAANSTLQQASSALTTATNGLAEAQAALVAAQATLAGF